MNKLKILLSALVLGLSMLPQLGNAQGSLIWNGSTQPIPLGSYGGINQILTTEDAHFGPGSYPEDTNFLFAGIYFGTSDVGRTFTIASQADDPNFNYVVNALTDGIDQNFEVSMEYGGGYNALESQLFAGIGTGPDLIGYQIQSFTLTIDSLTLLSPGSNPNGNGIWTDFGGQVTFGIYGYAVPEPSPSWLLLLGSGIFIYASRFCKKH